MKGCFELYEVTCVVSVMRSFIVLANVNFYTNKANVSTTSEYYEILQLEHQKKCLMLLISRK